MTFAALFVPAPLPDDRDGDALAAALLALAPHVALGEEDEQGRLYWLDARGLPARRLAASAVDVARTLGCQDARGGVARSAVVAGIAARHGRATVTTVRRGAEGRYLAPHALSVLAHAPGWSPKLAAALADVGVDTLGDLATLGADAVEVRFGGEGAALRRLARGEDARRIFSPLRRPLPDASLEWLDYEVRDAARLLFVANSLLERVCEELRSWGEAARSMTLRLPLAGGGAVERRVRGARATADRATWIRLLRAELERLALPDGARGIALRVDSVHELDTPQGDLFDHGFQSAAAAESTIARLADDEMGVAVRLASSAHPLPERRLRWRALEFREVTAVVRGAGVPDGRPGPSVDGPATPPAARATLALRLLPAPRPVVVTTARRRGDAMPVRYRERLADGARAPRGLPLVEIHAAAGPDRVRAGDEDGVPVSREYWTCLTDEALVLLFRNGRTEEEWYLQGWWD